MEYDMLVCKAVKSDPLGFVDILKQEAAKAPKTLEPLLHEAACVIANLLLTNENWQNIDKKYLVFKTLCRYEQNEYGFTVFSSKNIAESLKISRYAALKALHELEKDGLVEHGSMGCPAEYSGGEYLELIHEAGPPINGFTLTAKGRETNIYANEQKRYEQILADWASYEKPENR